MEKRSYHENISVVHSGKTFHGYRIVEGTQKLFQTIYYKSHCEFDGHAYKPHENDLMKSIAETILHELVEREKADP